MCDEFNNSRTIRELALVTHLYIEYFVNELIVAKLKTPEFVIDDRDLGSFKSKLLLLKAMGVFDTAPHVLNNIEHIQGIRNHYAHNLLVAEDVPERVINRIKQLIYFDLNDQVCEYDVPWSQHVDPLQAQLQICALETANALVRLHEVVEGKKDPQP